MIIIDRNRLEPGIGIMEKIPPELSKKISTSLLLQDNSVNEIEVIIISSENPLKLKQDIEAIGGEYEDLGFGFGIVKLPAAKILDLAKIKEIQYIEFPKSLYISDINSNKASCINEIQNYENLTGNGVIVGFIDSGIDFTNRAFINEDGTTRIEYLYDLSGDGTVYSKETINEALKSNNPFAIVNSQDIIKHGTHVAGIACAGGNTNNRVKGVAPKSSIIMVKVTRGQYSLATQIMRGLKFIIDKSKELSMPVAVNISLSTNDGAHNGTSLLEQYISTIAKLERVTIVIAAGNDGAAAHHVQGTLENEKIEQIFFNIGEGEKSVAINIYKTLLPSITLQLIDPTGINTPEIEIVEGYTDGRIGKSRYQIYVSGPKPFDFEGEIVVGLQGGMQSLIEGKWEMIIKSTGDYGGRYDMWLPVMEGLNISTKFFEPSILNTIGIPATVSNVISVGSYNYQEDYLSPFSGKGVNSVYKAVKPDLVAPGENIFSVLPKNSSGEKSGTSMATPQVTGSCALLLEWGILKGNDPYLYGERLKYYIVLGANRDRRDIKYPDPGWGYGKLCLVNTYNILSNTISQLGSSTTFRNLEDKNEFVEFTKGNIFIRKPI